MKHCRMFSGITRNRNLSYFMKQQRLSCFYRVSPPLVLQGWPAKRGRRTRRMKFCGDTVSSQLSPWRKASLRWTTLSSMPRLRCQLLRTAWKSRRRRSSSRRPSWLLLCATAGTKTAPWTVWRHLRTMTAPPSCPSSSRRSQGGTACPRSCWGWAPPLQRWLIALEICPWSCSESARCLASLMISRLGKPQRSTQSPWASQWQTYHPSCSGWQEEGAGWMGTCPPNSERWIQIASHKPSGFHPPLLTYLRSLFYI